MVITRIQLNERRAGNGSGPSGDGKPREGGSRADDAAGAFVRAVREIYAEGGIWHFWASIAPGLLV